MGNLSQETWQRLIEISQVLAPMLDLESLLGRSIQAEAEISGVETASLLHPCQVFKNR